MFGDMDVELSQHAHVHSLLFPIKYIFFLILVILKGNASFKEISGWFLFFLHASALFGVLIFFNNVMFVSDILVLFVIK